MPRQEHVLTVFVASPGDVNDERAKLEEVIGELNGIWSRELGIRLELIRWETHTYPGIGTDAQAVINDQIPDDYDIFIGIMWGRYGTPTNRAGSGTVEEFERARDRYEKQKDVKIMVYFKDEPIAPSRLDPDQLKKINDFKKSLRALGEEVGALYWDFVDINQFEQSVRMHLSRQIQDFKAGLQNARTVNPPELQAPPAKESESDEDALGIIELQEISQERFKEVTESSERIGSATEELGDELNAQVVKINSIPRDFKGKVDPRDAKPHVSKIATEMNRYTKRIGAEIPFFRENLNEGMNALIRAALMSSVDFKEHEDQTQAKERLDEIVKTRKQLEEVYELLNGFKQVVATIPRITGEINKAKRGLSTVLDELLNEVTRGQSLLKEAEIEMHNISRG